MYTLKEYLDEVKLRLSRHDVKLDLDDPTITTFINRARRQVQQETMALYPEHYGAIATIDGGDFTKVSDLTVTNPTTGLAVNVYSADLPSDFLEPVSVVLRYKTGPVYEYPVNAACRRVNKRELYSVCRQSHNYPSAISPTYALEMDTSSPTPKIYVAGTIHPQVESPDANSDTVWAAGADGVVEVWYIAALKTLELYPGNDFTASDKEIRIPTQFEELIVLQTIVDCLQKAGSAMAPDSVAAEMNALTQTISDVYSTLKLKRGPLLPSKGGSV